VGVRWTDPLTAARRIARVQAAGVSNEHLPTGWLLSLWLTGAAAVVVGLLAQLAPNNAATDLLAVVGVVGGGTLALHLSVPLAPRARAYLLTWRY